MRKRGYKKVDSSCCRRRRAPEWPDLERKGVPGRLTLQSSQAVGGVPGSEQLALAALSGFPFYRKEKEGKGCKCWPEPQNPGCHQWK